MTGHDDLLARVGNASATWRLGGSSHDLYKGDLVVLIESLGDALRSETARAVAAETTLAATRAPTAEEILAHIAAGGKVERWHPWTDGGGWGLTYTSDEAAWASGPPDQPQPGYRLALLDVPDQPNPGGADT